jgi:hypothetical protein
MCRLESRPCCFSANSDRGKEGNKFWGSYAKASDGKKQPDDCVKAMTEDEESVWLGVMNGQLQLFHNVKNWGESRLVQFTRLDVSPD